MRSTPLSLGIALVLGGAVASPVGCSETPVPVVPTVPVPTVTAAPPAPPLDLTPVAEPADIFVVARLKNPGAMIASMGACGGVPQKLIDTATQSAFDTALAHAFHGVDGQQIAGVFAVDAPVDFVVSLDPGSQPRALFAFSVGLNSLDRAKSALEAAGPLVELTPGLWRVGATGSRDLTCVIGPAAGVAPARLICGQHDRDVSALGPYLARNLPVSAPPTPDLHAELRFTPIDARYGAKIRAFLGFLPTLARSQAAIGEPRYDQALGEAASALADEGAALVSDLDHVTVDLSVDHASCLTAKAALQFRGKTSWLAGTLADRVDKAGPPPAIFWRAPLDSDSASYGRAADSARYNGIFRTLRGLLEGKLDKEQIGSEADRKALGALLAFPFGKDTSVVIASGHVTAASKPLPAGAKPSEQQSVEELAGSYLGWSLLGFDEGPAALSKLLKDVVAVYGRKALTDPLRKALGHDGDALPTAKFVPAPASLGQGALDLELHFEIGSHDTGAVDAKKKKVRPGLVLHVLLMGDTQSSWLAIGFNRDELVRRLLTSRSAAPDAGTLAARPGLEPLRVGKALSSGFITLSVLTRSVAGMLNSPMLPAASNLGDLRNTLGNLPHKGETPIFLTSTATGDGPRGEVVVNMQKGSFEDVGAILVTASRLATNAGLLRP
jgi:hypothetical protein